MLDITTQSCPMTAVHVRLAVDRMGRGTTLGIFLKGEDTLTNVRSLLKTLGLLILKETETSPDGPFYNLTVLKS